MSDSETIYPQQQAMSDNLSTLDSLPHEILTNVFVRLPIKSIVTCTAVCKTWKSLIQNPTFISNHLHHSSNNNNKHPLLLFRLCSSEKEKYVLHFDNQDFNEYTRFDDFPLHGRSYHRIFRVVGTCNGLIFLADYYFDEHYSKFFLFNPCVRKFVKLPIPSITCYSSGGDIASVGFGFDSKTNDYKVVRFVTLEEKGRRDKVQVYSLSTGKWRMVTALPPVGAARYSDLNVFVNGALHWVAFRKTENELRISVMVFDLGEEVFSEIALPKLSGQKGEEIWGKRVYISAYGNSLALFQWGNDYLSIWVMKHYADASSWSKIVSFDDADAVLIDGIPRSHCIPKGFRKSGEVILQMDGGYLVSRDLMTKEIKDLGICAYANTFVDSYVESLVLLDKPNQPNQLRKRRKGKRNKNRKQICGPMLYKIHRFWFFSRCKTQNRSWSKHSKHRKGSNLGGRNS